MATVGTSTQANPLIYPGLARINRSPKTGHLWVAVLDNAGTGVNFYRSTNNGASWALYGSWSKGVTIQELSGLHIDNDGHLHLAFRTYETGQDRIYWRRSIPSGTSTLTTAEILIAPPASSAAGAIHTGMDFQIVGLPDGSTRVAIAVGTTFLGKAGVTVYGAWTTTTGVMRTDNPPVLGTRQWMFPGSGRITPQIDIEHVGDGTSSPVPHLWVSFGRTELRLVKMAWSNNRWTGPTSAVTLRTGLAAQDSIAARWDGQRFLQAVPHPDAALTSRVLIFERNRANSASVQRTTTNDHPAGVVRWCSIAYNSVNGDFRVYAVGTSSTVLYYCDFIRKTSTFTSWTQVSASSVLNGHNWGVRHETYGNARYDVVHAEGVTPFTLVHTSQTVTYPPNAPEWQYGTHPLTPAANGAPFDVASALRLDWLFSDPDPGDVQTAYALSRQSGSWPIEYWRESDKTWQPAEVKNVSGTTEKTLAALAAAAPPVQHTQSSVNTLISTFTALGTTDFDLSADVSVPIVPTGAGMSLWVVGRQTDASNYYAVNLVLGLAGTTSFSFFKRVAGVLTAIGSATSAGTHVAGDTWRITFRGTGTALYANARNLTAGSAPTTISNSDASLAGGTGMGTLSRLETGNTNALPVVISWSTLAAAVTGGGPVWAASTDDAQYVFKVKTWDGADTASLYSDPIVVVPSVKANPTITSPTVGAVLTADTVTAEWTVAEQSAYRVMLFPTSAVNTNPYFETNVANWSVSGGAATFVRSTAQFHQGVASGLLTPDGTAAFAAVGPELLGGALGNRPYFFTLWARSVVARIIKPGFNWYDSAAGFIGAVEIEVPMAPNTWTPITVSATSLPGTSLAQGRITVDGTPPAGHLTYFDEAMLLAPHLAEWDSGWVGNNQGFYTPPLRLPDGSSWIISVQTRNLEGLSSSVLTAPFTVDYLEPAVPTIVAAPMPALGVIRVAITNPTPGGGQPALADQDLYRRRVGDTTDGTLVVAGLASGAVYDDWREVASGVAYQYRVLARGANGTSIFGAWTT